MAKQLWARRHLYRRSRQPEELATARYYLDGSCEQHGRHSGERERSIERAGIYVQAERPPMRGRDWQDHYPVGTGGQEHWAELMEKNKVLIMRLAAIRRDPRIRAS